ncbi:hypothetical protein ES705_23176 [subsurface metagenome]
MSLDGGAAGEVLDCGAAGDVLDCGAAGDSLDRGAAGDVPWTAELLSLKMPIFVVPAKKIFSRIAQAGRSQLCPH